MPELPEVETTCRGIRPHLIDQKIQKTIIRQKQLRWLIPAKLNSILKNKTIQKISRRGKYILINIDQGTLIIHLGMSGRLSITDLNTPAQKHDHVDIILTNDKVLRYHDPRRFGCILWTTEDPLQHKLLAHLGPEPLTASFTAKYLYDKSQTRKIKIKLFIMDGKVVVGVGNIYANEALFYAKINPNIPCNLISFEQYKLLVKHIKIILKKSIKQGGTTLKDFLTVDGTPGYFSQQLAVYNQAICKTCDNSIIKTIIGQRPTFHCALCQA